MVVIGNDIHQYTIIQVIGKGGCATVYLGKKDSTLYAIKEVKKEYSEFAIKEKDILGKLDHPNIVKLIEYFEDQGLFYLVLEYIEGTTLELYAKRKLSNQRILDLAIQLCKIIDYLHHQDPPIIHRDLKPVNMIIDSKGKIHLIDFGISEVYGDQFISKRILGTRGYSAPELYRNIHSSILSDIYTIGIIFLYLMEGKPRISLNKVHGGLLREIIYRCIQDEPTKRYQSVEEILVDLKKIRRKKICVYKWKLWS